MTPSTEIGHALRGSVLTISVDGYESLGRVIASQSVWMPCFVARVGHEQTKVSKAGAQPRWVLGPDATAVGTEARHPSGGSPRAFPRLFVSAPFPRAATGPPPGESLPQASVPSARS